MGDGRYYSNSQFFSIVYLTMLIIFLVVNVMLYIYKGDTKTIVSLYVSLGLAMLMSFIEAIAVSSSMIFLSKVFSDILLAVFSLFYIYLLVDVSKLVDKKILIALSLFFSLSLGISLLNLDSRIFVYLLLTANLSLVSNYYMPYRVTTSIFGDIKELVLDYVLIVDDSCQIIYKNNNIANSHVFKDIEKVDIQEIGSIFRDSTIIRIKSV